MVRTATATLLLLEVVNKTGRTEFARFCIKVKIFGVVAKDAGESIPETAMGALTTLTLNVECLRLRAGLTVFGR